MTLGTRVSDALRAAGLDPVDAGRVVRGALDEDFRVRAGATSAGTAPAGQQAVAEVVARQPGVLAGLPVALAVLDAAGRAAQRGDAAVRRRGPGRARDRGAPDPRPAARDAGRRSGPCSTS